MKRKRRKRLAKQWSEFQEEFSLTDEVTKIARQLGAPVAITRGKLLKMDSELSATEKIQQLHQSWQTRIEKRRAAIEAGEIQPKPKKKKKVRHDPAWAKAKKVCRLNQEDIRMAKELGFNPKSLMKNVPSPSQQWKAPVKEWIHDLYEKRERKMAVKAARKKKAEEKAKEKSEQPKAAETDTADLERQFPDDPF